MWKNIFLFSVPLMLSQLLEVMFNLSDVAVVGKFADYKALGAVGSTTLLVSLFVGFLIGMGSGVNVQVALGLGSRDKRNVEQTIHTSLILCFIVGMAACILCFVLARPVLTLMKTKEDLLEQAVLYLQIYALGLPGMAVYNFGNGVMSAGGDTRHPLVYLSIAGILNVLLNLFFVIVMHLAAAGVAIASVIAQYVSAVLIIANLLRREDECNLSVRKIRLHKDAAKSVLLIGLPTGIQNAIFAIANLFVQMGVNSFDTVMVCIRQLGGGQCGYGYFQYPECVLHGMRQLHRTEQGSGQKGTHEEELFHQSVLRCRSGCPCGRCTAFVRQTVFIFVCQQHRGYRCRHAETAYYGLFFCDGAVHGLHHSGLQRSWQKRGSHHYRGNGLLRVPCHLDLYRICVFPHHSVPVSSLYLFLDDNSGCGGYLF